MGCSSSAEGLTTGQLQLMDCRVIGYERLQAPCSCTITQAKVCPPGEALQCNWDVHLTGGGDDAWPTAAYYMLRENENEIALISGLGFRVAVLPLFPTKGSDGDGGDDATGSTCLTRDVTDGYVVRDGSGAPWCRMVQRKGLNGQGTQWVMRESRTNNALWVIDNEAQPETRSFQMDVDETPKVVQLKSKPEKVATWAKLPLATTKLPEWRDKEVHMGKGMAPAVALTALAVIYLVESGRTQ